MKTKEKGKRLRGGVAPAVPLFPATGIMERSLSAFIAFALFNVSLALPQPLSEQGPYSEAEKLVWKRNLALVKQAEAVRLPTLPGKLGSPFAQYCIA